jgi:two-component system, OmpR family, sensor histidine kinase VicK
MLFLSKYKDNDHISDKPEVIVNIKDTGTGIDPKIKSRLFSKFASLSESGGRIGLGLYLSKKIIEAHNGKIWAEDNVTDGKGSTFSFTLPLNNS